jgi:hypothetical protein
VKGPHACRRAGTISAADACHAGTRLASARSRNPGGVNAVKCDGSVGFYPNSIDLGPWRALGTIAGNDSTGGF